MSKSAGNGGILMRGRICTEETRKKLSKAGIGKRIGDKHPMYGKHLSEETRKKISDARKGKCIGDKHPMYGKHLPEETRKKLSEAGKQRVFSEEHRIKLGNSKRGENNPNWLFGISYAPYCNKFNNDLKERVREYFNRECFNCGRLEADNGRQLSVHHVNYDKMSCCNEIKPFFVPLCLSCHAKTNKNRKEWEAKFALELMERTGGKCFFTIDEFKNKIMQ